MLDNTAASVARNGLGAHCSVLPLTWGDFTPQLAALPPQDVLLGADVAYDSACFDQLLATVAYLLRRQQLLGRRHRHALQALRARRSGVRSMERSSMLPPERRRTTACGLW